MSYVRIEYTYKSLIIKLRRIPNNLQVNKHEIGNIGLG